MEMTMVKKETEFMSFGDWTAFKKKLNSLTEKDLQSEESLCKTMEIDFELYQRIIRFSINAWKSSPSKSLFHGMGKNGLTIPEEGQVIFTSHVSQTRFLLMLCEDRMISKMLLKTVKDENGEKLKVKGEYALTIPEGERGAVMDKKVNEILQILFVYFFYCRKQEEKADFKKPKKLYRGIRLRDFFHYPAIQQVLSSVPPSEKRSFDREHRKLQYDVMVDYFKKNGIKDICDNDLVSFTSSQAIAKYFANGGGLIIEVNTDDVEIMTSEAHDSRFAEKDYVSNKLEKEYIVRLSDEKMELSDIIISDLDYLIATNNPLAVSLFDHDDKSATYKLNAVNIKAYYVWTSNSTHTIRYRNIDCDSWGYSSKEFKQEFGFSPVISNKNLKDIQDFQIHISK